MSIQTSKKPNTSYYLGIDYGQSKIGLAIGDSETKMAFGYGILKNDKKLMQKLAEIIEKKGIEKIIIGIAGSKSSPPQLRRGLRGGAVGEIQHPSVLAGHLPSSEGRRLGELLRKKLNIPAEYQNEIFSTQMAERNLKEKGAKKIKRYDDREAARIILQSWLDRQA